MRRIPPSVVAAAAFGLALVATAVSCGSPDKDCFRWEYDSEKQDYVKDKTFCDDCCRVCGEGQACGDSCIASSSNCNAGSGCACNRL